MLHSIKILLACALLFVGARCVSAEWYEESDAQDLKDSRLVEHLRDPDSTGRAWAAYYLNQRWDGPKYVQLLKDDWRAGVEALYYWPKTNDEPLVRHLLTVERPTSTEQDEAAHLIAEHADGDRIRSYSGVIRDKALDLWCYNKLMTVPRHCADPSFIWFAAAKSRRWLREYCYKDAPWCQRWGSFAFGTPWILTEFRLVLAIFAGDEDHIDANKVAKTGWLPALAESIRTGKCAADVPLNDKEPENVADRLVSNVGYLDFVDLRYAELLCIICDRPDWLLLVRKRLQVANVTVVDWIPDASGKSMPKERFEARDISTPVVYALALAALGKYDEFFQHYGAYVRKEWAGYEDNTVPQDVWVTHPWMQNAIQDKVFQEKWSEVAIPLDWPTK